MAIDKTRIVLALLLFGLACLLGSVIQAAEEKAADPLVQMIVDLINDKDRDMRALGFQQVREEVPGAEATKRFAAMVKDLPPDGQSGLLEALGDRKDAAARPVILEMLDSPATAVKTSALKALGALGTADDVTLLAGKTAAGSDLEKQAARSSLIRLRGDKVNDAIVAALAKAKPNVQVALLGVLAARNARQSLPEVLKSVKSDDPAVRAAAIGALRFLANEKETAALVDILKTAKNEDERRKAELALLAVCSRGSEAPVKVIVDGLTDADAPTRIVLLHGLARSGGAASLEAIVARLEDKDQTVCDEALRMLSRWPKRTAVAHLLKVAKAGKSQRHQVLAIRGMARLAAPADEQPADMKTLAELVTLAERSQEKILLLGVLSGVGSSEALALVAPLMDDPALGEEAALAAVLIAEKTKDGDKDKTRAAMEKVGKKAKSQDVRDRAKKVLKSL